MVPSAVCNNDLDIISITDHNTAQNVAAFVLLCKDKIVVPGIEVHTIEDVHILGYFSNIENLMNFSKLVEENTDKLPYDPEKYGYQIVINEHEEFVETIDYYLGFPTNLTIDDTIRLIKDNSGLPVFAHVDRRFGAIQQLGFLPSGTRYVEVKKKETWAKLKAEGYIVLTSSDAHLPDEIGSRKLYLEGEISSTNDVIETLIEGRFKTIWD
ncbi:MAG: PHP-associated domain-containing protein [Fervidobacterium sp.]|uniref:PHP-associated domain-containing protein n=1 Tax=Fervidobacterium sp. TaxID=1871331 RepID=UPI00404B15C1